MGKKKAIKEVMKNFFKTLKRIKGEKNFSNILHETRDLDSVDLSDCPSDFKSAYLSCVKSFKKLYEMCEERDMSAADFSDIIKGVITGARIVLGDPIAMLSAVKVVVDMIKEMDANKKIKKACEDFVQHAEDLLSIVEEYIPDMESKFRKHL